MMAEVTTTVAQCAGQSEYGALLPYLTSFAHVLHGDTAALHPDDIVCHPVLIAAFDALASRDEAVLDAAVFAILAALDLASYAGTLVEGKQALCLFLVGMVDSLPRAPALLLAFAIIPLPQRLHHLCL